MMQLKPESGRRADAACVLFLYLFAFLFHAALLFSVFGFDRALRIYPDELRYYDVARGLSDGSGLTIRGEEASFQKIGYSLVMAPFFAVKDPVVRQKAIGLANIAVMSLAVWFVWLLGSELGLGRRAKCAVCFLTAIWPDMMYSMTYMSEILYWPLAVLFFLLWLANDRRQSFAIAAAEGLLCYVLYLTKEISLSFLVAAAAFEALRPFAEPGDRQGWKRRLAVLAAVLAVFAACHAAMKATLFRGMGNSYDQMGIGALLSLPRIRYLLYAFFYYIAAVLVASFAVPVVHPAVHFRHMGRSCRSLFLYLCLFGLVVAATIAYTISVRENFGDAAPALHLRYFGPFFVVLVLVFAGALEQVGPERAKASRKWFAAGLFVALAYACAMFKGYVISNSADQYILLWHLALEKATTALLPSGGRCPVAHPAAVLSCLFVVSLALVFFLVYAKKGKTQAGRFWFAVLAAMAAGLNVAAGGVIAYAYRVDSGTVGEIVRINAYFKDDPASDILYLNYGRAETRHDRFNRYADTYLDRRHHLHVARACDLPPAGEDGAIRVAGWELNNLAGDEAGLSGPVRAADLKRSHTVPGIDYILTENSDSAGAGMELANVEPVGELRGAHFTVYKNLDRETIRFQPGQQNQGGSER